MPVKFSPKLTKRLIYSMINADIRIAGNKQEIFAEYPILRNLLLLPELSNKQYSLYQRGFFWSLFNSFIIMST